MILIVIYKISRFSDSRKCGNKMQDINLHCIQNGFCSFHICHSIYHFNKIQLIYFVLRQHRECLLMNTQVAKINFYSEKNTIL